ncbi:MAG: hypothetical protein WDW36_003959 [Sanguina aurantia]
MTAETAAAPVAAPTPFVPLAKSARTACYVVKHFDAQQETLARKVKYLAKAIDGKASTAAGTLSGKSQI